MAAYCAKGHVLRLRKNEKKAKLFEQNDKNLATILLLAICAYYERFNA